MLDANTKALVNEKLMSDSDRSTAMAESRIVLLLVFDVVIFITVGLLSFLNLGLAQDEDIPWYWYFWVVHSLALISYIFCVVVFFWESNRISDFYSDVNSSSSSSGVPEPVILKWAGGMRVLHILYIFFLATFVTDFCVYWARFAYSVYCTNGDTFYCAFKVI